MPEYIGAWMISRLLRWYAESEGTVCRFWQCGIQEIMKRSTAKLEGQSFDLGCRLKGLMRFSINQTFSK